MVTVTVTRRVNPTPATPTTTSAAPASAASSATRDVRPGAGVAYAMCGDSSGKVGSAMPSPARPPLPLPLPLLLLLLLLLRVPPRRPHYPQVGRQFEAVFRTETRYPRRR